MDPKVKWKKTRRLLYGTKKFFPAKRLEDCLLSSFERRDETFGDEFDGSGSGVIVDRKRFKILETFGIDIVQLQLRAYVRKSNLCWPVTEWSAWI